jgi:nucleotide-binding universal stress UspA family protein
VPASAPIHAVLCAVDFSETSERAARLAAAIAGATGARVHLMHVLPLPMPSMPVPELGLAPQEAIMPPMDRLGSDARESLLRLATDLGLEDAGVHVSMGSPASEIVRLARELDVGMIAMGTHGRTGLAHLLLGSVAERVTRFAHLPVLVVPSPEQHRHGAQKSS